MKKGIATCWFFLFFTAVLSPDAFAQGGPTQGQGFHEDCDGTCTTTGGVPNAQCWAQWIHGGHSENGSEAYEASTSNCATPDGLICGEGSSTASWTLFGKTNKARFACTAHTCSISGELNCGGTLRGFAGGCAANGVHARATLFRDGAHCAGDPGNSYNCECSGTNIHCSSY